MELETLSKNLLVDLNEIRKKNLPILEEALRCINLSRALLHKFKKEILAAGFNSTTSEITFFKQIKQVPLVKLIYYSEIHSFEIQLPKADRATQLKFVKKKINKLNRFFLYNLDFGQYVNSGSTHFDEAYYTRNNLDAYRIMTSKFYFQDPDFCTPRDMLLGKFIAYNLLVKYMEQKHYSIKHRPNGSILNSKMVNKIEWPFTNTDWVELVYALWSAGKSKRNHLSIVKLSQMLKEIFDFEPKDIYKTYQDIKNRKKSRTLFLDQLTSSLLVEMDKSEE
ncbi:hypothetical protein EVU94_02615 [Flavobacteriaceae bacterium 144Ye]|nr:hypothetical protein EVU94_02615 [Flavobacteriaceae bacterium 144Ye]